MSGISSLFSSSTRYVLCNAEIFASLDNCSNKWPSFVPLSANFITWWFLYYLFLQDIFFWLIYCSKPSRKQLVKVVKRAGSLMSRHGGTSFHTLKESASVRLMIKRGNIVSFSSVIKFVTINIASFMVIERFVHSLCHPSQFLGFGAFHD